MRLRLQLFASTYEEEKKKTNAKLTGVDSGTMGVINSTYTPSATVQQADKDAQNYLNKVQSQADKSQNGIISQKYWNAINKPYQMSQNVSNAMNYTQQLLDQLSSGKTSYSDQVSDMINQIMNRDKFSYDPDNDTLFQQALASAMNSGKQAMQDTIGQASALTGGYGSSYATSAANQQYNQFVESAYDNLPQYYEMAMKQYQMNTEDQYNKLGMLSNADDKEYNRLYNSWNANQQNWTQLYDMEYGQWKDSVDIAMGAAGLQMNESNAIFDRVNAAYNASKGYSDSMYSRDYGQYSDSLSKALQLASLQNSDYWKRYSASQSGASKKQADMEKMVQELADAKRSGKGNTPEQIFAKYGVTSSELQDYYNGRADVINDLGNKDNMENIINRITPLIENGESEKAMDTLESMYGIKDDATRSEIYDEAIERIKNGNSKNTVTQTGPSYDIEYNKKADTDMKEFVKTIPEQGEKETDSEYLGRYNNAVMEEMTRLADMYAIPDDGYSREAFYDVLRSYRKKGI